MKDTNNFNILSEWESRSIENIKIASTIINIEPYEVYETIILNNGLLEATPSHIQLIQRDDVWRFITFNEIITGDILITITNELIDVISIEKNNKKRIVYKILLKNNHIYYANNVLTHNK